MKICFALLVLLISRIPAFAVEPVWQDDFNQPAGSAPNETRWTFDLGATGWGNAELQDYTAARENCAVVEDPAAVDGRALVIRAVRSADGKITSARLKTEGKFAPAFGRVEARLKLPRGQGIWPAFWMLGESITRVGWPACGEIDVMEVLGHETGKLYGTLHGPGYSGKNGLSVSTVLPDAGSLSDAYHVYAVDWSPGRIEWSLDGRVYHTCTPANLPKGQRWVFDDGPFFLLLNLAVGGKWPGSPDVTTQFPQELRIDYIRIYDRARDAGGNTRREPITAPIWSRATASCTAPARILRDFAIMRRRSAPAGSRRSS